MAREKLLVVGAGMAAGRLVHQLVERGYSGAISVAGDEAASMYNRVLLPGFLAGEYGAVPVFRGSLQRLRAVFTGQKAR